MFNLGSKKYVDRFYIILSKYLPSFIVTNVLKPFVTDCPLYKLPVLILYFFFIALKLFGLAT